MTAKPPKHRPFRALRGLRARATASETTGSAPREQSGAEPELDFHSALARAGVVPLAKAARRVPKREPPSALTTARAPAFSVTEADNWLEGFRTDAGPSALRGLRGKPAATLDLHGASAAVARRRLTAFIAAARAGGRTVVLVIVGKGRHSPGGRAVLRGEIAAWLTTAPNAVHIVAFATAPPDLGGTGGVLVRLAR